MGGWEIASSAILDFLHRECVNGHHSKAVVQKHWATPEERNEYGEPGREL
jgi:hypothetical protein